MLANPYSEHAEKTLLGCVIRNGVTAMHQCLHLRAEHFYHSTHREIFGACRTILERQSDIDAGLVAAELGHALGTEAWAYIDSLTDGIYRGMDPSVRAASILEAWRLRQGMTLCNSYASAFASGERSSAELFAEAQAELFDAMAQSGEVDDPHVSAFTDEVWQQFEERASGEVQTGLSYGLAPLDTLTGGLQPGQVAVVGARSGVGKSCLMKQTAAVNLARGVPVSLFSLEMSRAEILAGLWSIVSGVPYRKLVRPHLCTHAERDALAAAKDTVKAWPLRIYEDASMDLAQIIAFSQRDTRQYGTALVAVDYAQSVCTTEGKDERTRVAAVSRGLTKMAKNEGCSLLLLSQLRKVPHEQYKHPPTAADLRETGQLENDAHCIVLLHRGWDDVNCHPSNDATLVVAKNRHGSPGAARARFNPSNLCFEAA
jgi:replicative DNA helicase